MLVAGETLNIFLLTGISNINIFFIKKNNVVVNINIDDQLASKILTYKAKKEEEKINTKNKYYANKFIKNQHIRFSFEMVEDVCLLPGAGQNRPFPLLLPSHNQIEDDLLNCNGDPCPTQRSDKNSSWVIIVSVDDVVEVELLDCGILAGED